MYKANVRRILTEGEGDQLRAVGVQLLDGRKFKGQVRAELLPSIHLIHLHTSLLQLKCRLVLYDS